MDQKTDRKGKFIALDSLEFEDEFKLSFINRVRLFFGGSIIAVIKLDTQKPVGRFSYDSGYLVQPVFPAKLRYRVREYVEYAKTFLPAGKAGAERRRLEQVRLRKNVNGL